MVQELQNNISRVVIDLNRNINEIDPKTIKNLPSDVEINSITTRCFLNSSNTCAMKPVEFSHFFTVLNALKEGSSEKQREFDLLLSDYKDSNNSDGPLHQLGQIYIHIGVMKLFEYTDGLNIQEIGKLEKLSWEEIAESKKRELPPFLANSMINYAKKNKLSEKIANRWGIKKREIEKNIMQMARYITEGIIDAIE